MDYVIDDTSEHFERFMSNFNHPQSVFEEGGNVWTQNTNATKTFVGSVSQVNIDYPGLFIEAVNVPVTDKIAESDTQTAGTGDHS